MGLEGSLKYKEGRKRKKKRNEIDAKLYWNRTTE
jgi:hypothetical protein